MAFKFVFLVSAIAVLGLSGSTLAEFDYKPELYNGNTNINNNNVNNYNDNMQQPANSYNAPLMALNGINNNNSNNSSPKPQQSASNGYNYNVNNLPERNYNNNIAPVQPLQQQQQPQKLQTNYDYNNGVAKEARAYFVPTPAGYDYTRQNLATPSSSSSVSSASSASSLPVGTLGKLQTSFSAQAHQSAAQAEEYNTPVKYDYSYNVHDENTGDIKSHAETRDGYSVKGSYTVVDPDGFQRTVSYIVDGPSGFKAVVSRVPYALRASPAVSATTSSAAAVNKLAELPLSNGVSLEQSSAAAVASTVAGEKSEGTDATGIDLPVQPRDNYLAPPADSRDGKGPYA